mgnify:CR=1 FL=1
MLLLPSMVFCLSRIFSVLNSISFTDPSAEVAAITSPSGLHLTQRIASIHRIKWSGMLNFIADLLESFIVFTICPSRRSNIFVWFPVPPLSASRLLLLGQTSIHHTPYKSIVQRTQKLYCWANTFLWLDLKRLIEYKRLLYCVVHVKAVHIIFQINNWV